MNSRTARIMQMIEQKNLEQQKHEEECFNNSTVPFFEISQNSLLVDQVINDAMSSENFSELIDKAEVVFINSSSKGSPPLTEVEFTNVLPSNSSVINNNNLAENSLMSSSNVIFEITSISHSPNKENEYNMKFQSTLPTLKSQDSISAKTPEITIIDQDQSSLNSFEQPGNKENGSEEQNSNNSMSSEESEDSYFKEKEIKKIKMKGVNQREINKNLRMKGERYLGYTKPKGQRNTLHNKYRQQRKLGERCACKSKSKKLKFSSINEGIRQKIKADFWNNLNWDQRKIYVSNTVKRVYVKRPRKRNDTTVSRRTGTMEYTLNVNNETVPVCKKMYLNTLCIGEWSVRNWTSEHENGLNDSFKNKVSKRKKREDLYDESRQFLRNFLESLNKLPSHYCRKDTKKMYLEQCFQSFAQLYRLYESKCKESNKNVLSIVTLTNVAHEMDIALFHPRKDQCDTCFKYKNKNLSEEEYNRHIKNKTLARAEKELDKQNALLGKCYVITMDVQAVKLAPQIEASALYYKTKLCCHNFTIFNLKTHQVTCYWFNETEADGQAATYASFVVDYIKEYFLGAEDNIPIIIYSDGCTAQNRNAIMANALLFLSEKFQKVIIQKFLEKGHTQMECDSVHSAIETALKNREIYLPSDYHRVTKEARLKDPYVVKNMDFNFFLNYGDKSLMKYSSIRPGKVNGPTVTDIRALQYSQSTIKFKLQFDKEYEDIPTRPKHSIDFKTMEFPKLFLSKLPISQKKYEHLQQIKSVIPKDCWSFYDQLPYK